MESRHISTADYMTEEDGNEEKNRSRRFRASKHGSCTLLKHLLERLLLRPEQDLGLAKPLDLMRFTEQIGILFTFLSSTKHPSLELVLAEDGPTTLHK
ncbi:unnamed protein product [Protopolystoma xenopodis]|uniref:Uncharacterized protein n=1 Tax=Protopolystoma xenopodis TaxID=117903 RepID=A0A448X6L0_9PLAT|nr:unnamed protein product [Protopolystoma xenopodis]